MFSVIYTFRGVSCQILVRDFVKETINKRSGYRFVSLSQTKKKMLRLFLLNESQKDLLLYAGLIIGAIVLVGLITKLIGYEENQNDLNEEYDEDEEFAGFSDWDYDDVHMHNDDCDHHEFHDDCDHDD